MGSTALLTADCVTDSRFDGVVLLTDCAEQSDCCKSLQQCIQDYVTINAAALDEAALISCGSLPGKRLILSPTGPLNRDYDDCRRIYDAAETGIKKALKVGCGKPLLVLGKLKSLHTTEAWADRKYLEYAAAFGALHACYVPVELREVTGHKLSNVTALGLYGVNEATLHHISALEEGRIVARDIGGSDPERMAAPKIVEYLTHLFGTADSNVKMHVKTVDCKEYPLMAAVDRAAKGVARHAGRVIHLEYEGKGPIIQTLYFVGKGITYDTGGADIKAGGHMAGMHRDKCGAAAVAGFFRVLQLLKPVGLRVQGAMACVRNSVGLDCYVSDEIITSRAGVRVRVGNTDAEGRMVMADLLCEMKERAAKIKEEKEPLIFSIATLTGHVIRCYGENYTALLDNGKARQLKVGESIQHAGDLICDPCEISRVRREDYKFVQGPSVYEDVLQCNNLPSSQTERGHMMPAAFMIIASGLDKHGLDSEHSLAYTHIDIAGSSGPFPGIPTGAPILALSQHFILPRL